ncbi:T9SS type A sorting domain-containing protein [Larkinella terrae]|uniref:Secretion system C-terminal sorting domain-containing protein n=1 Tax=Larkinella terrae TaxID=2025311 RepID=A0A7K0EF11_9BACT|nr:T9SS type A sorting domain-containing protein [Larkinella terrae]MRS60335.1 hypothetical protein [Larkinella terrae]
MKTLIKSLLVAVSLTVVSSSFAAAKPIGRPKTEPVVAAYQSSLYTDAQGKLRIAIDKETGGTVEVRLVNSEGKEVFVQEVGKRRKTARMHLDISALPDGAYQVEITNGVDTKVNHVSLATQQPSFTNRLIAVK